MLCWGLCVSSFGREKNLKKCTCTWEVEDWVCFSTYSTYQLESSVYQFVSDCKGMEGRWGAWNTMAGAVTCFRSDLSFPCPVLCERCKDTSSDSWCVSVRDSFRLKHWMVINLQPAGLHCEEKIAVLEKRILTPRKQEMSDKGDVLSSETNWELGSLLYVLQGSAGVQVSDA